MLKKILNALLKSKATKKPGEKDKPLNIGKTIIIGPRSLRTPELNEQFPCYTRNDLKIVNK